MAESQKKVSQSTELICHEKISDEWIKGKLHGQVGMFPSAFVEMLEGAQEKIGIETGKKTKFISQLVDLFFAAEGPQTLQ